MTTTFFLGLGVLVLAVVGLLVARTFTPRQRASPPRDTPPRQETRKSRLTIMSELAGIVGVIIAIIGLLVR